MTISTAKNGSKPSATGAVGSFSSASSSPEFWVLWKCSSAGPAVFGDKSTLRAGEERFAQPPNQSLVCFFTNMKENGTSKIMEKLIHCIMSIFTFVFIGFCITECVGAMIYCVIPSIF